MRIRDLKPNTTVTLYKVTERWFSVEHDSPCLGAKSEHTTFEEVKGVYSTEEKANKAKKEFLDELTSYFESKDKYDQLRMAGEHGIDSHEDYEFSVSAKPVIVQLNELTEKGNKVYLNLEGKLNKIN